MSGDESATIKAFPQLSEGRPRINTCLGHPLEKLVILQSRKACRPTQSPTTLLDHLQSLRYPPLANSLVQQPPHNLRPLSPVLPLYLPYSLAKIVWDPRRKNFQPVPSRRFVYKRCATIL